VPHKLLLDPTSLFDLGTGTAVNGPLHFVDRAVAYTTMLYELDADVIPNWFGVAVPDGITDFTRPTIYFHPNPDPPGYKEGPQSSIYFGKKNPDEPGLSEDDRNKRRKWWQLFEYVERLGAQLAGAVQFGASPNQVVVFPFMTASTLETCGILPKHWKPIVTDILGDVRQRVTGVGGTLAISNMAIAGYSYGHTVATNFRLKAQAAAPGVLSAIAKQVIGFDGSPSMSNLSSIPGQMRAIKYDQNSAANTSPFDVHVALARWSEYTSPVPEEWPGLPAPTDVHHLVRDFLYLDAAMKRELAP
jgi:hypothetical protein